MYGQVSSTIWDDVVQLNVTPNGFPENTHASWNPYGTQTTSPVLLGGDTTGNIYHLDNPLAVRDGESSALMVIFNVSITTTCWIHLMPSGQKTQLRPFNVHYSVASGDPANPIQVTFNFDVDNNAMWLHLAPLTFDGPVGSDYAWKRVYCNLMGEFIRIGIDPSEDAPFQINGFVLWARPAGRLTP